MKKTSFHFHEAYGYQTWREVASKERCYPQSHKFCWSSVRIRSTWWLSKRDHLPYWSYCPTATWRIRYVISLLYFYKAHGISDGLYNGSPRTNSHVSLITGSYVVSWKLGKRLSPRPKEIIILFPQESGKNWTLNCIHPQCYGLKYFVGIFSININMLYDKVTFSFPSII